MKKDRSVKKALKLVKKWLKDKSDYDEKNYPDIEQGLKRQATHHFNSYTPFLTVS